MSSKSKKIDEKAEQLRIDSIRAKFLEQDDEEDEVKYETIMEYCKESKTCFHDGEFPHTDENLGKHILNHWKGPGVLQLAKEVLKKKELPKCPLDPILKIPKNEKWHRLAPLPSDWKFSYDIEPMKYEVFQNGIGNCGLIAAISAVSAHGALVNQIFRDPEVNEYGVYQVRLCHDGEWEWITVDDWIPCVKGDSRGASVCKFLRFNHIWPAILEKAFAKMYGGYEKIRCFDTAIALGTITGAPIESYRHLKYSDKVDEFWKILKDGRSNNYLMTCSSYIPKNMLRKYAKNVEKLREPKVSKSHAYTIISVMEVHNHRMLRLRNPWGRSEWNGKWSNQWTGWTDEMILELIVFQNTVTGSFWIEFDDFMKYFDRAVICRWRDSWTVIRLVMVIGGLWDDSQKAIRIRAPKTCEISVTAIGKDSNKYHSHTWISIYRVDEHEEMEQVLFCEPIEISTRDVKLQPGDYIVMITSFNDSCKKKERKVAIHSSHPISATFVSLDLMRMVRLFQKNVEVKGREVLERREDISIKKYEMINFSILMAQNYTHDKYLHVHTRCTNVFGSSLSRGGWPDSDYGDVIPPRSSQILLIIYQNPDKDQIGFPMNIEYFMSKKSLTKIGRSSRAAHTPALKTTNYIHQTIVLE